MKMKKMLVLPAFLAVLLSSCSKNTTYYGNLSGFQTVVEFQLYEGKKENVDEIEEILWFYHNLSNKYYFCLVDDDDNQNDRPLNIYDINKSSYNGVSLKINEKLYKMLQTAFKANERGAKYFNPFIGSLSDKWKNAIKENTVLSDEEIAQELNKISTTSITFGPNYTIEKYGEAEIDLGAFAKGYVLDQIEGYLNLNKINKYIIDAGSSSILLGSNKTKDGLFTVGLKDVENAYFKAKNCYVSTSSISEQSATIDGVTYSHIINPFDGSAVCTNDAVVVITNQGYLGDVLSTSMMHNTIDEIKVIEQSEGVKTIVIKDGKITYQHPDIEVLYH